MFIFGSTTEIEKQKLLLWNDWASNVIINVMSEGSLLVSFSRMTLLHGVSMGRGVR